MGDMQNNISSWKMSSSGMWRRVYIVCTEGPPKRGVTQDLHGVTNQKTVFFIVTAVKTSNLTQYVVMFIILHKAESGHSEWLMSFRLQLHLVHWNSSKYTNCGEAAGYPDGLAVLGVLLKVRHVTFHF
jgi:hypothetical protein